MKLSTNLQQNITTLKEMLPIGTSFDFITRDLVLGERSAYWVGINGMCNVDLLHQALSNLQDPYFMNRYTLSDIADFMHRKMGHAQIMLTDDFQVIEKNLLSGPTLLMIDGFSQALVIDMRIYPQRGIQEPEAEKVTRGSRDGFNETLLTSTNLLRRRIRSPKLVFEMHSVGTSSQTDVALAYIESNVNKELLQKLVDTIDRLQVTSLTMGSSSLLELLVKKRWWNPLPSIQMTERPDVAASFLEEGHILIIVDNSPMVLILPCTIFQFTQCPEDYHKTPIVGTYFRLLRFLCIPVNTLLLPVFLLITTQYPELSAQLQLLPEETPTKLQLIIYCIAIEIFLDLFRYSTSLRGDRFTGPLSIVGGLIIGEIATNLNWASPEVLFYGAVTLLTSLTISSMELGDALRIYRYFILLGTAFFGIWGFWGALALTLISIATTPTFGGMSYFWPLFPFQWQALRTLLFRYPTYAAQPSKIWKREKYSSGNN